MPHVKIRILIPVALPCLLAATVLAGCSDDEPAQTAAPATTAAAASSAPAADPGSQPISAGPSGKPSAGAAGCPVTAAALEKAFKANPRLAAAVVLGKGLKDVSCYDGWATAVAQPTNLEAATVLFKYDTAKKSWVAVSGGTDGVCRDAVPQDIATHLKGCQN
jgi:hypothetical protein